MAFSGSGGVFGAALTLPLAKDGWSRGRYGALLSALIRCLNLGYARASTAAQQAGFEVQLRELEAAGCERIFNEKVSSVAERAQLEQVLDWLREGDVLTVTRLDRLARSTRQLLDIAERVKAKGATLRVLPPARSL
jgi:DNA invertase Pin-like site-specific DNA recombinase